MRVVEAGEDGIDKVGDVDEAALVIDRIHGEGIWIWWSGEGGIWVTADTDDFDNYLHG